jgi:hypothetical protein
MLGNLGSVATYLLFPTLDEMNQRASFLNRILDNQDFL